MPEVYQELVFSLRSGSEPTTHLLQNARPLGIRSQREEAVGKLRFIGWEGHRVGQTTESQKLMVSYDK